MAYTIRAVELLVRIPGGSLALGAWSLTAILAIYALILGWAFLTTRVHKLIGALSPTLAVLALGSLAVVVWREALAAPDGSSTSRRWT